MGMTYDELTTFGRLRKEKKLGPFGKAKPELPLMASHADIHVRHVQSFSPRMDPHHTTTSCRKSKAFRTLLSN